jgi:hypothetical protein
LFVPGNHNVSFAIVRPDGLFPEVDATAMVELYNRTMRPAAPRTKATDRYVTDQVFPRGTLAACTAFFCQ